MILFFIMFTQNTKQIKATVQWMKIIKVKAGEVLFNMKINANFLFGGFIASYESWCVNEQLCFVSTVVRKLPQIKNFVYPLCVCDLNQACKFHARML